MGIYTDKAESALKKAQRFLQECIIPIREQNIY